jgi:hypothetical protein
MHDCLQQLQMVAAGSGAGALQLSNNLLDGAQAVSENMEIGGGAVHA